MYDLVYSEQGVMKERYYGYANVIDEIRRFESRFANLRIGASASNSEKLIPEQHDPHFAVGNI